MGKLNHNLNQAKQAKNDEFYTQLADIEKELQYYKEQLENKVVFCNCDDPEWSNFWRYFSLNFDYLGLKRLIATHFDPEKPSYKLEIVRGIKGVVKTPLKQNGDFRSPECLNLLQECDIVVTNPPFSLFREYLDVVHRSGKKFLIIGNLNAITYKETFKLIQNNELWLGVNSGRFEFMVPPHYQSNEKITRFDEQGNKYVRFGNIGWYTNMEHRKRHEPLQLYRKYDPMHYPKYDNYDAIEVSKVSDIPEDYDGLMGVPITFLDKYNPDQFEIIGIDFELIEKNNEKFRGKTSRFYIDGKKIYARIVIRNKNPIVR